MAKHDYEVYITIMGEDVVDVTVCHDGEELVELRTDDLPTARAAAAMLLQKVLDDTWQK